jgi:hypothetical protein
MKNRASQVLTIFATTYLVIVLLLAGVAIYAEVVRSQQEHSLPGILLFVFTLPSSSSLTYLYEAQPAFFGLPFVQCAWLTLCGLGQAWLLFALPRVFPKGAGAHHRQ